jgi:cysteine peptidase C11 family protein
MSLATGQGGASGDAKWTIMVFMGAATIAGNEPLIDAAEADLQEMRFVGSGDALNIFAQVHQGGAVVPRRGRITEQMRPGIDALESVPEDQQEPRQGLALLNFIKWALTNAGHNPNNPNHYSMLVLWGHAYDFAIGREKRGDGTIDALDFADLTQVLERLQLEFAAPGAKLDILGFDACDLATVEMACQLEPFAKYLLGSQIGIPLPGLPYDRILERLRQPYGRLMGPAEFGSYTVRRFCQAYSAESRTVSLTLLDLSRTQEITAATDVLALTLLHAIGAPDALDRISALFSESQTASGKPFVDVADLCLNLARNSEDLLVMKAAKALGDVLIGPRPPSVGLSVIGGGLPFVVEHGRNTGQTARLNGISIYAPHVTPERNFDTLRAMYGNFVFAQKTQWSGLVHALAGYALAGLG